MLKLQKGRLFAFLCLCSIFSLFALSCTNFVNSQHFHTVTVHSGITGGEIKVNKSMFSVGETVNLIIKPNQDYSLRRGSLYYVIGKNRVLIPGSTFIMPSADIVIYGNFDNDNGIMANLHLTSATFVDKMYLKCTYFTGNSENPPPLKWSISNEDVAVFDGEPKLIESECTDTSLVYSVCLKAAEKPLYFVTTKVTVNTENDQSPSTCEISIVPNYFKINEVAGNTSDGGECWLVGIDTSRAMECVQEGSFRIPDYISGYKVTRIGEGAFQRFNDTADGIISDVTSLIIPPSVSSIGNSAFEAFLPNASATLGNYGCLVVTLLSPSPPEIAVGGKIFNSAFIERATNVDNPLSVLKIVVASNSGVYRSSWADWSDHIIGMNESQIFVTVNPEKSNGIAYSNRYSAAQGELIDIICEPDSGYQLQTGSIWIYKDPEMRVGYDAVTEAPYNRFVMPNFDVYVQVSFIAIPNNYDLVYKVTALEGNGIDYISGEPECYYEFDNSGSASGQWNMNKLSLSIKAKQNYYIQGVFYADRGRIVYEQWKGNDFIQYAGAESFWSAAKTNETGSFVMDIPPNSYYEIHIFVEAITSQVELHNTKYGQHTTLLPSAVSGNNTLDKVRSNVLATIHIKGGTKRDVAVVDSEGILDTINTGKVDPEIWTSMYQTGSDRMKKDFAGFVTEDYVLTPIKDTEEDRKKLTLRYVKGATSDENHKLVLTEQWDTYKTGTVKLYAKYYEPEVEVTGNNSTAANHYITLDMNGGWFRKDVLTKKPVSNGTYEQEAFDYYNLPSSDWVSAGSFNTPNEPDNDRFSYVYKLRGALYDEPIPQTVSMCLKTGTEETDFEIKIRDIPFTSSATAGVDLFAPVRPGFKFMGFYNFPQSLTVDGANANQYHDSAIEGFDPATGKYLTGADAETAPYKFYSVESDQYDEVFEITKSWVDSDITRADPVMYLNSSLDVVGAGVSPYNGRDLTIYAWWEEDVMEATDSLQTVSKVLPRVKTVNGSSVTEYQIWSFRDLVSVSSHLNYDSDTSTEYTIMRNIKMHPTTLMKVGGVDSIVTSLLSGGSGRTYAKPTNMGYFDHQPMDLRGKLDGQGYKIDNIYIAREGSQFAGIFNNITGSVKNIVLGSGFVKSDWSVQTGASYDMAGALAASCTITYPNGFENVYNRGVAVAGRSYVGGLVADFTVNVQNHAGDIVIQRCGNTADIIGNDPTFYNTSVNYKTMELGGLFGVFNAMNTSTQIKYMFNEGCVRVFHSDETKQGSPHVYANVGGIAGRMYLRANYCMIGGMYNTGELITFDNFDLRTEDLMSENFSRVGALFGVLARHSANYSVTVKFCYNTADIKAVAAGGLFTVDNSSAPSGNDADDANFTDLYMGNIYNSGRIISTPAYPGTATLVAANGHVWQLSLLVADKITVAENRNGETHRASWESGRQSTHGSSMTFCTTSTMVTDAVSGSQLKSSVNITGRPDSLTFTAKDYTDTDKTCYFSQRDPDGSDLGFEVVRKDGQNTVQIKDMHETGSDN